jgi:hypothetical protein
VADEVDNLIGYPHCREWSKGAAAHPARRGLGDMHARAREGAAAHPARRNRSEFVRLAIVEKLERDKKLNT